MHEKGIKDFTDSSFCFEKKKKTKKQKQQQNNFILGNALKLIKISINLLVVYRESVNLIGYITCRLSADSLQS